MNAFRKIAVLGGGLLGGSLAMALQGRSEVSLWARRRETVRCARERGILGATDDLGAALSGADLVILAVPVGAMDALVRMALDCGLDSKALVSDVGSVKRAVHQGVGELLRSEGIPFIGGHPMAGSELTGVGASRSDLFAGAVCLLTDDQGIGGRLAEALEAFWVGLGSRVCWTDAARHDDLVARISHFPHLMAAATALVSLNNPTDAIFGGGGLRDTTRVAGGDPSMWAEILMENRAAVSELVGQSISALESAKSALEKGDHDSVLAWLRQAFDLHQASRSVDSSTLSLS